MKTKHQPPTVRLNSNYQLARSANDWHVGAYRWQGEPDDRWWLPEMTDDSAALYRLSLIETTQLEPSFINARGYTPLEKVSEWRETLIKKGIIKPYQDGGWDKDDPILYAYGDRYVPARVS